MNFLIFFILIYLKCCFNKSPLAANLFKQFYMIIKKYSISESQIPTQRYGRRPFGVGLLVAGYDDLGTHLYQTCPSANYYECKSMAIGARSQSARTYLEKHLNEFPDNSCDELIRHALRALRDTLPNEIELSTKVNYLIFFSW